MNKEEIIDNLKSQYGVYELSLLKRIVAGIAAISVVFAGLLMLFNSLARLLTFPETLLDVLEKGLLILFMGLNAVSIYVAAVLAVRLFFPRPYRINFVWERLTKTGIVINGRIIETRAVTLNTDELAYEFSSPMDVRITGRYVCKTRSITFSTDKHGSTLTMASLPNAPHPDPKEVKVWYLDERHHTLL